MRESVLRTHFVIASVAWQSRRRSNGGSSTCVQPIEIATSLDKLGMSESSSR